MAAQIKIDASKKRKINEVNENFNLNQFGPKDSKKIINLNGQTILQS